MWMELGDHVCTMFTNIFLFPSLFFSPPQQLCPIGCEDLWHVSFMRLHVAPQQMPSHLKKEIGYTRQEK